MSLILSQTARRFHSNTEMCKVYVRVLNIDYDYGTKPGGVSNPVRPLLYRPDVSSWFAFKVCSIFLRANIPRNVVMRSLCNEICLCLSHKSFPPSFPVRAAAPPCVYRLLGSVMYFLSLCNFILFKVDTDIYVVEYSTSPSVFFVCYAEQRLKLIVSSELVFVICIVG